MRGKWLLGVAAILLVGYMWFSLSEDNTPGAFDDLAQCITDSGAKMYGAYWCPHCKTQKEMFGNSWRLIDSIECSLPDRGGQKTICHEAGIRSYPTWEFVDGSRVSGAIPLDELAERTNCPI